MEMIVGALSPSLVNGIEQELDRQWGEPLRGKLNFRDASRRMLMSLLITESEASGASGRLYADSLVHALATEFVQLGSASRPGNEAIKSRTPRPHSSACSGTNEFRVLQGSQPRNISC